ncbi:hypothetical protein O0235_09310 [Tepidiforma flava]|uniref:Uncharacterized protein n=1 Tax=Tepidiforma flava TaxID=3004094 RepID=A0ABY7M2V9_9CHLR|nr:hypothetical protein O0235_09310 [Tepidiforma flava]
MATSQVRRFRAAGSLMRRARALRLRGRGLDDLDDADAEVFIDDDDFAAGDEAVVDEDVDGFAGDAVEFDDGAGAEAEDFGDGEAGPAEFDGDVHFEAGEEFDAGGVLGRAGVGQRGEARALGGDRRLLFRRGRGAAGGGRLRTSGCCGTAMGSSMRWSSTSRSSAASRSS